MIMTHVDPIRVSSAHLVGPQRAVSLAAFNVVARQHRRTGPLDEDSDHIDRQAFALHGEDAARDRM